jgi:hypothetical protein
MKLVVLFLTFLTAYIKIKSIFSCMSTTEQTSWHVSMSWHLFTSLWVELTEYFMVTVMWLFLSFYRMVRWVWKFLFCHKETFQGLSNCRITYKKSSFILHNLSTSEMIYIILVLCCHDRLYFHQQIGLKY